ncbi:MAG: HDOD domain-containing protein [Limisphaerales bacterium]
MAAELLGLFDDPDHDIDRVVELISHDPGLTVAVLKRCNSAYFSNERTILDMFDAVTRLGFYEVHCIVASLIGARAMSVGKGTVSMDVNRLWQHSVTTAIAASALARRVQTGEATAFTAGLLHDVGKLVFAAVEKNTYADLIGQAGPCGQRLADAEQTAFGVSHAAIGSRLLTRWGLPETIAGAALHHHSLSADAEPFARLAATIGLASDLAHQMANQESRQVDLLSYRPRCRHFISANTGRCAKDHYPNAKGSATDGGTAPNGGVTLASFPTL